jgi:MFS transporter, DHA1 family, multidrug resistance protein
MIDSAQRRSFWLFCSIGFLAFISYDLIRSPLLPLFAGELGASPQAIGLIVGASTITGVLFKLPSGMLSDHLGRPRMLLIGLLVFAVAPYGYLLVHSVWPLLILRFFHGLATGIFAPVAMAVVVDLFRVGRGEALGWYSAFTQAGRLLGRMAGGYLILWVGFGQTFIISAAVGFILLLLFLRLMMASDFKSGVHRTTPPHKQETLQGMHEVAGDRRILATSGMEALQMLASGALMAFLPLYAMMIGLHAGQIGLLFGIQGVSSILTRPLMGRVSDQLGRRYFIVSGQVLCAVVVGLIPWIGNFWALLVLAFFFGLGEAIMSSSTSALVADLCKVRSFGSAMGVFGTIMDVGHASGPILAGFLIGLFGYRSAFGIVAILLMLMTVIFLWVLKMPKMEQNIGKSFS